jgi:hypothetical protein
LRSTSLVAALLAIALVPAAANAAPKQVRFSFASSTATVNENAGTYNLTVTRSLNTRVSASVDLALSGTATGGGTNYTFSNPGTITFAPGETRKTFPVTITDDNTFNKPNKTIVFTLSNPQPSNKAQLKNNPLTLTILDNDGPGTLEFSQSSYSVIESAGAATITVNRNGNPLLSESVDYATSDGTAHQPGAYTATSGTVTIGVGEMSKTFQVPINDDQAFEGDESLNLALSNPQNLTNPADVPNAGPAAALTIDDDDVPTFAYSSSTYSVNEGDGSATITVNRGGATYVAADVDYSTSDGTAHQPGDYTATSGTLHFAAGDTQKTFQVPIVDDGTAEGNETVNLDLSFQGNSVSSALLSIVDNDSSQPSVQFSTDSYNVAEGGGNATVTVTLSKAAAGDVTVDYATGDISDTAGSPSDYANTSGTLDFTAGQTSKTIDIPIVQDSSLEGDETFSVTLSSPSSAVLGSPNPATVTILDDDSTGTLDFSAQRYDVNENAGHVTITVNRAGGSAGPASVDYATSDGTAHEPGDYSATHGTLSFADGQTQKRFDIPVNWDGRQEGDETISVTLSNFSSDDDPSATKVAVVHIADDGASGPVQFSAPSYDVIENAGQATITVNRSGGSLGGPVTVDYATSDGTAHAGADYTAGSGTLTFGPGDASKTFAVPVANDNVHQGSRSLNLTLSNPGGGTSLGSQASATLNIGDDDPVSSSSKDLTPPALKLTVKKNQKVSKLKRLVIKVRSNEAAKLAVKASLRKGSKLVRVAKASKRIGQNKTVTIKLKLNTKALAKLRAALANPKAKGKAKIKVTVTGTDAAGNKRTISKTVVVR